MQTNLNILKGLHPGIVLDRELRRRKLGKGRFALSVGEFPQTLGAITKARRRMNTALALKIETALGLEEGYLMTLQVFYDIKEEKRKQRIGDHPDLGRLRPVLFWDTLMDKIDWRRQKKTVIKRVFERGNEVEKNEITHFYGKEAVDSVLKTTNLTN